MTVAELPADDTKTANGSESSSRRRRTRGGLRPRGSEPKHAARGRRRRRWLVEWLVVLAVAGLVAVGLRTFVFQVFYVPTTSMVPTIVPGDRILVDKFGSARTKISTGEIIVFHRPPDDTVDPGIADLVKRVIGLPGQTIWSAHGQVYIDGRVLKEPWLPRYDPLGPKGITRQKIPPDHYFVMGDNRAISYDSRYFGPISGKLIVGKVIMLLWRHGHPDFHRL
jgi:signal peptidase I